MTAVDKSASDKANPTGEARAAKLIAWFNAGAGGRIRWNTPGDFDACVRIAGKHMTPAQAKGFCNRRHQDATGHPPGKHGPGKRKVRKAGRLALLRRLLSAHPATKVDCPSCGAKVSAFAGSCSECGAVVTAAAKALGMKTSAMVALYPEPHVAESLALDGGELPEALHVTLGFLGSDAVVRLDRDTIEAALAAFAANNLPVDGVVGGVARFNAPAPGEPWPLVALVDAPNLTEFRQRLVGTLAAAGVEVATTHGYTAHATLALVKPEDEEAAAAILAEGIEATPLHFGTIVLAWGDDRTVYRLEGSGGPARAFIEKHGDKGEPGYQALHPNTGRVGSGSVSQWVGGLSADDKETLLNYQRLNFVSVNGALRGKWEAGAAEKQATADLDRIIDDAPPLDEPETVYRAIQHDGLVAAFGRIRPGTTISDGAFQSTTRSKSVATRYAAGESGVLAEIRIPAGTRAVEMAAVKDHAGEAELLLHREVSYKVIEASTDDGGTRRLVMELVPGSTRKARRRKGAASERGKSRFLWSEGDFDISVDIDKSIAGARTFDERRDLLNRALKRAYADDEELYAYVADFTDDWAVFELSGRTADAGLYRVRYLIGQDSDEVAFGDPEPVNRRTDYVLKTAGENGQVFKATAGPVIKSDEARRYTLMPLYPASPESPSAAHLDAHGDFATADDVQAAVWDYVRKGDRTIRDQHRDGTAIGECVELMCWPHEVTVPLTKADGTTVQKTFGAGTAFMGVVWNDVGWEDVTKGRKTGLSLGGMATRVAVEMNG